MEIYYALEIDMNNKLCVCFVGAGGKTSAMFRLANELHELGKRVVVTTTTKIYFPEQQQYNSAFVNESNAEIIEFVKGISEKGTYIIGSKMIEDNKLKGIDTALVCDIMGYDNIDYILVECDGSKRMPIKAPNESEPAIPACASIVVGVVGLDAIGSTVNDKTVHRLDEFCKITASNIGDTITTENVAALIKHPLGLFKNSPIGSKKHVLLNKADTLKEIEYAHIIKDRVKGSDVIVHISSLKDKNPIII